MVIAECRQIYSRKENSFCRQNLLSVSAVYTSSSVTISISINDRRRVNSQFRDIIMFSLLSQVFYIDVNIVNMAS